MKNIYFAQPNSIYGGSVYFPYAAGSLLAYAFADPTVSSSYEFGSFIYKKEDIDEVVSRLEAPDVMGFSCYVWNYEYNKALAAAVKKRFPGCVTVFGGHQIYRDSDLIDNTDADILVFGEGEEIFRRVLLALAGVEDLSEVPNIRIFSDGRARFTRSEILCMPERVSPYLSGWFDSMLEDEKELEFSGLLETNRGCPNRCAFCDWGNIKSRVRLFDEETVMAEIEWMSRNKIEYVYAADANFGLFPRDGKFIDRLILCHERNGYPQKFQATYAKRNPETVFELNRRLNAAGLSKGATLSFQSMSQAVLDNIGRSNMPLEDFKRIMEMYHRSGIPTYSELILGLPGETYESFRDGLGQLLRGGQHMSINFYNCELLNNSIMNDPAYIEKFDIKSVVIEQHQYHVRPYPGITEYSKMVISTSTLPAEDWVRCGIIGNYVRAFHNLGLLQCFALYLFREKGVDYMDFYEELVRFSAEAPDSVIGRMYYWMKGKFEEILDGMGSLTWREPAFGELIWPLEESAFLMMVREFDRFYEEVIPLLRRYIDDEALLCELLEYQKSVVKTPYCREKTLDMKHDWFAFFNGIYENKPVQLEEKNVIMLIRPGYIPGTLPEFAEKIVWYGRKGGANIVLDQEYIK